MFKNKNKKKNNISKISLNTRKQSGFVCSIDSDEKKANKKTNIGVFYDFAEKYIRNQNYFSDMTLKKVEEIMNSDASIEKRIIEARSYLEKRKAITSFSIKESKIYITLWIKDFPDIHILQKEEHSLILKTFEFDLYEKRKYSKESIIVIHKHMIARLIERLGYSVGDDVIKKDLDDILYWIDALLDFNFSDNLPFIEQVSFKTESGFVSGFYSIAASGDGTYSPYLFVRTFISPSIMTEEQTFLYRYMDNEEGKKLISEFLHFGKIDSKLIEKKKNLICETKKFFYAKDNIFNKTKTKDLDIIVDNKKKGDILNSVFFNTE